MDETATSNSTPTAEPIAPFSRTMEIGDLDGAPAFAEVEIEQTPKGPRLSICGTHAGGGGQCLDSFAEIETFRPGWTPARRDRLLAVWRAFHLNDMQAACVHQGAGYEVRDRACRTCGHKWTAPRLFGETANISGEPSQPCPACDGRDSNAGPARMIPPLDTGAQIVTRAYSIDWDENRRLERAASGTDATERGRASEALYYIREAEIAPFAWRVLDPSKPGAARGLEAATRLIRAVPEREAPAALAEEQKREQDARLGRRRRAIVMVREERKTAGWVRYTDDPRGCLGRPCGVCGYKYGSAWLYLQIPAEVIDEIRAWPSGGLETGPGGEAPSPYDVQADRWLQRYGVRFEAAHVQLKPAPWAEGRDKPASAYQHWRVTLRAPGVRPFVFDFWDSQAATAKREPLRAYSVLAMLASDRGYDDPDEIASEIGPMKPSQARKVAAWGVRVARWLAQIEERTPGASDALDLIS